MIQLIKIFKVDNDLKNGILRYSEVVKKIVDLIILKNRHPANQLVHHTLLIHFEP
jgi:hypothetical protein